MKLIYCVVVILAMVTLASAAGEKGKFNIEGDVFGKSSPIKLLMEGVLSNGKNTELTTYVKVFNQVFPLLKAFTDSALAQNGQAVKEYRYQWCFRDTRGDPYFCADFLWNFVIGWRADQFNDAQRFYNLTITPYAFMDAQVTFSSQADPVKLAIGPSFNLLNFTAPVSFEMVNKDTLCYSGSMNLNPITIVAKVNAAFLECRVTIPEDTHQCDYTERIGARIYSAQISDGYRSSLLDRTCVKSG